MVESGVVFTNMMDITIIARIKMELTAMIDQVHLYIEQHPGSVFSATYILPSIGIGITFWVSLGSLSVILASMIPSYEGICSAVMTVFSLSGVSSGMVSFRTMVWSPPTFMAVSVPRCTIGYSVTCMS